MESQYTEKVMEHFNNPRNVGEMRDADGRARVGDPSCGDFILVWIKVKNDTVADFKYKVFGCAAAIATTSVVSELAIGKTFAQAGQLTDDDVVKYLGGLPDGKKHCSLLGIKGLQAAIEDYKMHANYKKLQQRNKLYKKMGYDIPNSCDYIAGLLEDLSENANILEIGTGKGNLAIAVALSGLELTSIDNSDEQLKYAAFNAKYLKVEDMIDFELQDAAHTDYESSSFHAIISCATLHHIEDTEPVLAEMDRLCRKGGRIVLADLNEKGKEIVARVHREEGREHQVLGWPKEKIQEWFQKKEHKTELSEKDCMWVLKVDC